MKHCLACGLNCYTSCSISSSAEASTTHQTPSPPALSPLLPYASSSSRPANFIYPLFTLNLLLSSRHILCTRYLFQLLIPRYGAQLGEGAAECKVILHSEEVERLLTLPSMAPTIIIRFVRTPELPRCCVEIRSSVQSATSATLMDI